MVGVGTKDKMPTTFPLLTKSRLFSGLLFLTVSDIFRFFILLLFAQYCDSLSPLYSCLRVVPSSFSKLSATTLALNGIYTIRYFGDHCAITILAAMDVYMFTLE